MLEKIGASADQLDYLKRLCVAIIVDLKISDCVEAMPWDIYNAVLRG